MQTKSAPRSPTRGKYLVQNPAGYVPLFLADCFLGILTRFGKKHPKNIPEPKKILLSNGAHLGDVLLSTGILKVLKEMFPNAEFGFLTGSWSRQILEDHPMVDHLHLVDHWKLNRSKNSRYRKLLRYLEMRENAKNEIERIGYDLAIDLYCYFPNTIPLLYQAGIPVRIGFTSGGFGPLLTHSLDFRDEGKSILWHENELVRSCLLTSDEPLSYAPCLSPPRALDDRIRAKISGGPSFDAPYLVFHMGSGSAIKEWPAKNWHALAALFSGTDGRIVLTGVGEREHSLVNRLKSSDPDRFVDLCDQLDWKEFCSVIGGAELVVTVDSVAGHIAAATGIPCVVIGNGVNPPAQWQPLSDVSHVLIHSVPCAPCYRSRGCKGMECIAEITPQEVFEAAGIVLEGKGRVSGSIE